MMIDAVTDSIGEGNMYLVYDWGKEEVLSTTSVFIKPTVQYSKHHTWQES